jgi:4-amino-4-deoxy-L-arabinose transferase-like glycosyltransferase
VISDWSAPAWGAIGVTAVFIGLTCWWLTQDRSIPIFDAGYDLRTVIEYHDMIRSGDLLGPFSNELAYPPLGFLVGAFAMLIGGVNVASPIIGANIVFVSLLAVGCYQTGRLLFGGYSGMLAVIFALGSPLLITQFHVFLLDAPEAALAAVSIWLLLASENFSRRRIAAVAGVAVGCGLLIKVTFPSFVIGIVLLALVRGGWRNWRGLALFAAIAFLIGAPWYLDHLSEFGELTAVASGRSHGIPGVVPPLLSSESLTWYFWSTLNSQLLAPLFLLVIAGSAWTIAAVVRGGEQREARLEFLVGAFVAWLAITMTPHHDIRYGMALLPYLAVIGTGWIIFLPRAARFAVAGVLVLTVAANTLGSTFGVGGQVEAKLVHSPPPNPPSDRIVFYSSQGAQGVAGPRRDGDVPGLLRALRRDGVRVIIWEGAARATEADFSTEGLLPLAVIAGLEHSFEPIRLAGNPENAALLHFPVRVEAPPTCTRLSDGTGVWVFRGNPTSGMRELYCPFPRPHYYPLQAR